MADCYWYKNGFIHSDIHDIPSDAVPIEEERWRYLLLGEIIVGSDGLPYRTDEDQPAEPVKSKKKK
jgi:hypothetical protein